MDRHGRETFARVPARRGSGRRVVLMALDWHRDKDEPLVRTPQHSHAAFTASQMRPTTPSREPTSPS